MQSATSNGMDAPASAGSAWVYDRRVGLTAGALVVVSLVWRAAIAARGYLTLDDFPMISQADRAGSGAGYLLTLFNNHFMPAGKVVTWLTHRLTEYDYWPYLTLLIAAQAVVSVLLYRLLRVMLAPGWTLLVPMCVFLFSPLTLEATSWWAVGINMLPTQMAMILAVGAQVRYVHTRNPRHLLTLGLSVALGLVFFEKALLVVALVFLLTVCLYAPGGPVRALVTAIRRWWPSWLVLTGISLVFLALYLSQSTSSLRRPASVAEVGTFLAQIFGHSLVPGLAGGPWHWLGAGDGAPIVAPGELARWTSWLLVAGFLGFTIWLRRSVAVRAWILLLLYALIVAGLLGATRLGSVFSGVAGAVPRYIADVVVVAAICVGVALCGLRWTEGLSREDPEPHGAASRWPAFVLSRRPVFAYGLVGGLVLLLASSAVSGQRFGADWADKAGRDYLANARADLAVAPAGTVFMDQPVPEMVVGPLSAPDNLQSRFLAPLDDDPIFVTQARNLSVFDDAGHVRPAWVDGVPARPGPAPGCGYRVTTEPVRISLASEVEDFWHVVRIAYISDRDGAAAFRVGAGNPVKFDVFRGLNAAFLLVPGGGTNAELTAVGPAAICTNEITVGRLVPAPAG